MATFLRACAANKTSGMDCVGRNWPLAGPAHTPNKMEAPTHSPPASHRHRPRLREHSHSSSAFTGVCCSSRSSTSAKLRAGGRGEGNGEWESSQVVSGDAVRQSPGSTPLGRSILTRRVWRPGCGSARCASGRLPTSREAAVAAQAASQIPEDTTYLPSTTADGAGRCGSRQLAVRVTRPSYLLAAGAAN